MSINLKLIGLVLSLSLSLGCKNEQKKKEQGPIPSNQEVQVSKVENREVVIQTEQPENVQAPEGMVWIPGGTFIQGAVAHDKMAMRHENPSFPVSVNGFFMDINEVTNADFIKFVDATGYITIAEREIDWEEMKKQLPAGTPRPDDSFMQPGSLLFKKTKSSVANLYDFSQWWEWKIGANWKQPNGPGSTIEGKENHPVVHMAYDDALAYCEWIGRRLPTEAE